MTLLRFLKPFLALVLVGVLGAVGYLTRETWLPWLRHGEPGEPTPAAAASSEASTPSEKVIVSDQAQKNLGLTAKPLKVQTFWKTIQVPGMIVDRPGISDRGVVAPATGVITKIAHVPGNTVRQGELLFTLKLTSELLHATQTDLFKATQNIKLALAERARLTGLGDAIARTRVIEKDNEITRLRVAVKAYRQELLNRGIDAELLDAIAEGTFVREISIHVPARIPEAKPLTAAVVQRTGSVVSESPLTFEVQELKVDLGQQVQAGQTLCLLANHQLLAVEGRAFRDETPLLERSVKEKWPVEVDFQEDASADWPTLDQPFRIRHLANTIDSVNRTFAFLIPLENQSRAVEDEGQTQLLWRFRPGQKVRIRVRVEQLDNVFVLPADAVAREGPEAYVFTQNVNTFTRKSVRVLLQDRQHVVVANDGSLVPGTYVVQAAAAQLSRMAKAGASPAPRGYHIHADGSLHKNEDEVK